MSEKRFVIGDDNIVMFEVIDMEKEELVCECRAVDVEKVVDLLNEQQATIQFLQNEIDELKKDIDIYKYEEKKHSETARKLYEENEQLKEELNNLKKDETMLYHYYTLARYGGD